MADADARVRIQGGKTVSEAAALQSAVQGPESPACVGPIGAVAATAIPSESPAGSRLSVRDCAALVLELSGLWVISKVGYAVVALLRVPLPGNVAGMLLLFALLCTRVVP